MPLKARTWARRGCTQVLRVSGKGSGRVSLAGLIALKPASRTRLIYRAIVHHGRKGEHKGFREKDFAARLDAAHQQLGGPLVLVWDNTTQHVDTAMRALIATRSWLTVIRLPPYAPDLNPVEGVWPHLKRSLGNLAARSTDQPAHPSLPTSVAGLGVTAARCDDTTVMRRKPSAKISSEGVTRVQLAIQHELGWLFREQASEDYGIDAHVEVVDRENVTGRILALQIKSGTSWFSERGPDGWWFRPDEAHVQYWLNHSLPVAVVLYNPDTDKCHWQLVSGETLSSTAAGGWRLLIPEVHVLDADAEAILSRAAKYHIEAVQGQSRTAKTVITPLGIPVEKCSDPFKFGVHRSIIVDGANTGLPLYVPREHDSVLAERLAGNGPRLLVLVGGSSTGKTRAAYEAVRKMLGWRLYYPVYPSKPDALIAALESSSLAPKTVLWLNELQDYLLPERGEHVAAALRNMLDGSLELCAIGTLWPEYWQRLTAYRNDESAYPQCKELLNGLALRVDIDSHFSPTDLNEAASKDARVKLALDHSPDSVTQYLAGGPALLEFYADSLEICPGAWAIITAAMDAQRLGEVEPLSVSFLERAAPGYLSDDQWSSLRDDWFSESLQYACTLLRGAVRPLTKSRSRPPSDSEARYRLADYLLQHSRVARHQLPAPGSFWQAIQLSSWTAVQLYSYARAANDRGLYEESAILWNEHAGPGYDAVSASALLNNASVDPDRAMSIARECVGCLDLRDTAHIVIALTEFMHQRELADMLVARIADHPELPTIDDPFAVSVILDELESAGKDSAAEIFATRIARHLDTIEIDNFWDSHSLMESLLSSNVASANDAGMRLVKRIMEEQNLSAENLATMFSLTRDRDREIHEEIRRRLDCIASEINIQDPNTFRSAVVSLQLGGADGLANSLLTKFASQLGDVELGQSAAPVELLDVLIDNGFATEAADLAAKISREFDPGLAGFTLHTLKQLTRLGFSEAFQAMAERMAHDGPILPIADAEELLQYLQRKDTTQAGQVYADRLAAFRRSEGA